jgi:hypothetical protein
MQRRIHASGIFIFLRFIKYSSSNKGRRGIKQENVLIMAKSQEEDAGGRAKGHAQYLGWQHLECVSKNWQTAGKLQEQLVPLPRLVLDTSTLDTSTAQLLLKIYRITNLLDLNIPAEYFSKSTFILENYCLIFF